MSRIFLLSPARADGRRAQMLVRPQATFELARQVQIGAASVGEIFAFCSGLYFRGKLIYARRFAATAAGVQVITPSRGLIDSETLLGVGDLAEFGAVPIEPGEPRFSEPLQKSAAALAAAHRGEVVLLGSIATGKYVDALLPIFGERLLFPADFVGRGDMSRGALLLRCAASGEELACIPVSGALRRGRRAQRVAPPRP